jgi:hypothetical protein
MRHDVSRREIWMAELGMFHGCAPKAFARAKFAYFQPVLVLLLYVVFVDPQSMAAT